MNALEKYRLEWFYVKPAGIQEEPFEIPFQFTVTADGTLNADLPIQIDNEDIIVRGIFFDRIEALVGSIGPLEVAYFLARLRDTYGNPVSDGLTLMLGGWANPSGAGCGFPIDPELPCAAGGTMLLDVQFSSLA